MQLLPRRALKTAIVRAAPVGVLSTSRAEWLLSNLRLVGV